MGFDWKPVDRRDIRRLGAIAAGAAAIVGAAYLLMFSGVLSPRGEPTPARAATTETGSAKSGDLLAANSVDLKGDELKAVKVEEVTERVFAVTQDAVGYIDFNQDNSLQVFTPYPGRIKTLAAVAGDDVKKGQLLFEIDSPDLVNAESNLISTASTVLLNDKALKRAKELYASQAIAQKDYEAAVNAYEMADGSYRAARDAVRIFGKTDAQMDQIVASRHVDGTMPVYSPINGRVTARNAAIGLYVQPGNTPAPFTVSDLSTMWMFASVPEAQIALLKLGQEVDVKTLAYPGQVFAGKIVNIGAQVDPNTHRLLVRSEVGDPNHALRAQMFATFTIRTGQAMKSLAAPEGGVVREGDGTMTAWVTTDGHRFTKRSIKVGLQQEGYDQVLDGLKPGERLATEGALFMSNALTASSR